MKSLAAYWVLFAANPDVTAEDLGVHRVDASDASLGDAMGVVYFWAGLIAVVAIIIGGFLYVTSTGEPAKTKRAKDTILYSVVGLFIVIFAFFITQFILGRF